VEPVNGLTTWDGAVVEPAAVSVPVTVTDVQPGALTVNVAAPVPDEFAATVTGCGRFQLLDVSVTELPADTDRPLLPAAAATLTVMPAAGAADSETPNTSLVPWATENEPGLASRLTPDPHEPPPVEVGDGDAVGVGVPVGVGEEVGVVDGLGDGDPLAPLQAVPLMVNAAGAVLVPL
jgi:hypothetical protein